MVYSRQNLSRALAAARKPNSVGALGVISTARQAGNTRPMYPGTTTVGQVSFRFGTEPRKPTHIPKHAASAQALLRGEVEGLRVSIWHELDLNVLTTRKPYSSRSVREVSKNPRQQAVTGNILSPPALFPMIQVHNSPMASYPRP